MLQSQRQETSIVLQFWFHVVVVLVLYAFHISVTDANKDISPTSLGIRSGLFNGPILRRYRSNRSKVVQTSTSVFGYDIESNDEDSYNSEDDNFDNDRFVGSAFLKINPRQKTVHHQIAQSALVTKVNTRLGNRMRNTYTTELDFLEQRLSFDGKRTIDSFSTRRNQNSGSQNRVFSENLSCSTRNVANLSMAKDPTKVAVTRPLVFWENMICGAISRSVAQTTMHPANTMKTILQNTRRGVPNSPTIGELMLPRNFRRLTVGAGANFLLSVPHGALNFAVLELVRKRLSSIVQSNPFLAANESKFSFGLDFLSSSISTVACSVVSTPQMMITDNIMAGNYPNLKAACIGLAKTKGINGFYAGWWPGLVGKIPSYALTWTFFQQLKRIRSSISSRPVATDAENSIMGCIASATTVCLMIPMDTIKTRRKYYQPKYFSLLSGVI